MTHLAKKGTFERFDASSYKIGIVRACFNIDISESLLEHALQELKEYNVDTSTIAIHAVPGSIEIPVIAEYLAQQNTYDCLVALGAIIEGETPHFQYVASMVSEGITAITLKHTIPIGFGILTTHTHEQACDRVTAGADAVVAALTCARIIKK